MQVMPIPDAEDQVNQGNWQTFIISIISGGCRSDVTKDW